MRVLIVDDSSSFLDAASQLLEREGLTVAGTASTVADALRQSERLRPDVVLVDVFLGHESGFELARRLATARQDPRLMVILISTHDEASLQDLIDACPANGFIPKTELSAAAIRGLVDDRLQ